jgi:hypothetical protein
MHGKMLLMDLNNCMTQKQSASHIRCCSLVFGFEWGYGMFCTASCWSFDISYALSMIKMVQTDKEDGLESIAR